MERSGSGIYVESEGASQLAAHMSEERHALNRQMHLWPAGYLDKLLPRSRSFACASTRKTAFPSPPIIDRSKSRSYQHTELGKLIGTGAFSQVYRGYCRCEPVAVKVIPLRRERVGTIKREVQLMRSCDNSNLVTFLDAFLATDSRGRPALWLVMELCEMGNLLEIMKRQRSPFAEGEIMCITNAALLGLEHLHGSLQVTHRDVKAANILVTLKGRVKLADLSAAAEPAGALVGTPHWMAPELLARQHGSDECEETKADIWSLGVTLIELAEMRPPHAEIESTLKLLLMIAHLPPPGSTPASRPSATELLGGVGRFHKARLHKTQSWPRRGSAKMKRGSALARPPPGSGAATGGWGTPRLKGRRWSTPLEPAKVRPELQASASAHVFEQPADDPMLLSSLSAPVINKMPDASPSQQEEDRSFMREDSDFLAKFGKTLRLSKGA
ncbi:MAG: hypothetical protein SGPRY_007076 [Prymnesium sp.]